MVKNNKLRSTQIQCYPSVRRKFWFTISQKRKRCQKLFASQCHSTENVSEGPFFFDFFPKVSGAAYLLGVKISLNHKSGITEKLKTFLSQHYSTDKICEEALSVFLKISGVEKPYTLGERGITVFTRFFWL